MKTKIYILVEKYTLNEFLKKTLEEVYSKNITPVLIHDISILPDLLKEEHPDQPILWYEHQNCYMPLTDIDKWLSDDISKFPGVVDQSNNLLGFYPRGISGINGTNIDLKVNYFKCNTILKEIRSPNVEHPRLILYTWNRCTYFEITLNSLINSLPEKDRPPLTIVLNDSPENFQKMKQIALDKAKIYGENVEILHVAPNSKLSAICIALIWNRKNISEHFVILEDDFILPCSTNKMYPDWPKLFVEKLKFFDVCTWCVSMDNFPNPRLPKNYLQAKLNLDRKILNGERWVYNEPYFIMAQAMAVPTKFYLSTFKKHSLGGTDSLLLQNSTGTCYPTLVGYHLGWNQQQDGYGSLNSNRWGNDSGGIYGTYQVHNLITDETRTICPNKELSSIL